MLKKILILLFLGISLYGNTQNLEKIGFIDDITINDREFESLEQRKIEFYPEDLKEGKVVIEGLLEPLNTDPNFNDVFVEITIDGGETWQKTHGSKEWNYSFEPVFGQLYSFSLRLAKKNSAIMNDEENSETLILPNIFSIAGFSLIPGADLQAIDGKISGNGKIFVPWLQNIGIDPNLDVSFQNLSFDDSIITDGIVEYNNSFDISIADISLHVDSMKFSPNLLNNKIVGNLSFVDNILLSNISNVTFDSLPFNLQGINGDILYQDSAKLDIWPEQNVSLDMQSLKIKLDYRLIGGFSAKVVDLNAELNFGNLLNSTKKAIEFAKNEAGEKIDGVYKWTHSSSTRLISDSSVDVSNMIGELDLSDLMNPKIMFDASVNISAYGGVFNNINSLSIKDAVITKYGFFASVEASLSDIDILKSQNVKLEFQTNPRLNFSINNSGFNMSVAGGEMQLDFGNLLENAKASISPIVSDVDGKLSTVYAWNLDGIKKIKNGVNLSLKQLSGQIDLKDFANPKILINASADLTQMGGIFSTITSASIENGIISKSGVDFNLGILLNDIDIWEEKGVKLTFIGEEIPTAHFALNINGIYSIGFDNFDGKIDFGTLIPDATASLQNIEEQKGIYNLVIDSKKALTLIDNKVKLNSFVSTFDLSDLSNPSINFSTKAILSGFDDLLPNLKELNINNAKISREGFSASASLGLNNIDIWKSRGVKLAFNTNPKIDIEVSNRVKFALDIDGATLNFGELLNGANATLTKLDSSKIYTWSLNGSNKLVSGAKIFLETLSGKVNLSNLSNPEIRFDASLNLSKYGKSFVHMKKALIENAVISKNGFKAKTSLALDSLDIWKEKNVKLVFEKHPSLNIEVSASSFNIGFSNIEGNLEFGSLLDGAIAQIRKSQELSTDLAKTSKELIESNRVFTWELSGNYNLFNNKFILNSLSGVLDFSSFDNPKISLNANANIKTYSSIFKYVRSASIENALISKSGFSGSFSADIDDIPIYREKNVKIVFADDTRPTFNLAINSSGLKVGIDNLQGGVDFGTLINDAQASIQTLENGVLNWSFNSQKNLAHTNVLLKQLSGTLNLDDLSSPVLTLNGKANLSQYVPWLSTVGDINLENALISKSGFEAVLSASLDSIDIWQAKRVKLLFNSGVSPKFKFGYNNKGLIFGIKQINASIDFGDLLNGEIVSLSTSYAQIKKAALSEKGVMTNVKNEMTNARNTSSSGSFGIPNAANKVVNEGILSWSLSNSYTLLTDANGTVSAAAISGTININELLNPIITFDATADFSAYTMSLPASANIQSIKIDDATISRSGLDWNLILEGINAQYVIYDMGNPTTDGTLDADDVSIVLNNASATIGSSGVSIGSAAGSLNFGKLFQSSVEPISLVYSSGGYTFSTEQTLSYTYEGNSVELSGISGTIQKVGDSYSVSFDGAASLQVDILKNIGVEAVSFSDFDISRTGFRGTVTANWGEIPKVYNLVNGKAKISLSSIGVTLNTQNDIPISISNIGGYLDLSEVFDSTSKSLAHLGLSYENKTLTYSASHAMSISKFLFKDLEGILSLQGDSLALGLSGNFGYKGIDNLNVTLSEFIISTSGLEGDILYNPTTAISTFVSGLKLRSAMVGFHNNISGAFGLDYSKTNFLGSSKEFTLSLDSELNETGITSISASSNIKTFTIPKFATFNFNTFGISPNFDADFYLTLAGNIKAKNDVIDFKNSVNFSGLTISPTGVTLESAAISLPTSGAKIKLGGMIDLSLSEATIGLDGSIFFIDVTGDVSIGIAGATGGFILKSNKAFEMKEIGIFANLPGVVFGGTVAWGQDATYGSYFGTKVPLSLRIADFITADGEFKVGNKDGTSYWMAKASGGLGASGIPMGPITAYTIGGGVAKNMTYRNGVYTPATGGGVVVSLKSLMGTPDLGFTWHGDLEVIVDLGSKQLTLNGVNYILSPKSSSPTNLMIDGTIILGASPTSLQIKINQANITYQGIGVKGKADILFSGSEKHVFIGTNERFDYQGGGEPSGFNVSSPLGLINLTIFGQGPKGYFMVDSRRLAFGLSLQLEKRLELHIWGPNPYIEFGTKIAAAGLIQYNPFYMDLSASADVWVEIGYGDIWDGRISAGLAMRLRTPNPTYMYLKTYVHIPYYGNASFSTYIGDKPSSSDSEQEEKLVLLSGTYADTDISILPKLNIMTAFRNDGRIVESQVDGNSVNYKLELTDIMLTQAGGDREILLIERQVDQTTKEYIPVHPLSSNTSYLFSGKATLYLIKSNGTRVVQTSEDISKTFRTQEEYKIKFDELVDHIEPNDFNGGLWDSLTVKMFYKKDLYDILKKSPALIERHLRRYTIKVTDNKVVDIPGTINLRDKENQLSYLNFTPTNPFKVEHYCINEITGERKDTHLSDVNGAYLNPFNDFKLLGEPYGQEESTQSNQTGTMGTYRDNVSRQESKQSSLFTMEPMVACHTDGEYNIMIKDTQTDAIVYATRFSIRNKSAQLADPQKFEDLHHKLNPIVKLSRHERYVNQYKLYIDDGLEEVSLAHGVITGKLTYSVKSIGGVMLSNEQRASSNGGAIGAVGSAINNEDRVVPKTRHTNNTKITFTDTVVGSFASLSNLQITYYLNGESTGITKDVELMSIDSYDTSDTPGVINDGYDTDRIIDSNRMQTVEDVVFGGQPSGLGSDPVTNPSREYNGGSYQGGQYQGSQYQGGQYQGGANYGGMR